MRDVTEHRVSMSAVRPHDVNGPAMMIRELGTSPAFRDLVLATPFPDWDWLMTKEEMGAHELEQFESALQDPASRLVTLERHGKPLAAARVFLLDWDTRVLGLTAGRAKLWFRPDLNPGDAVEWLRRVKQAADQLGVELLDLKIDARVAQLAGPLRAAGFYLVDCLVSYASPVRGDGARYQHLIRPARAEDRPELVSLTLEAFSDPRSSCNRFVIDPHLGVEKAACLYTAWMANLLDGNGAEAVLVSEHAGKIAGYITFNTVRGPWQTRVAAADIPLNAVSSAERGRGHYTDLVNAVFSLAHERGCTHIHIRTQLTAVPVHATWARRGAHMVKTLYSFHAVPEERV